MGKTGLAASICYPVGANFKFFVATRRPAAVKKTKQTDKRPGKTIARTQRPRSGGLATGSISDAIPAPAGPASDDARYRLLFESASNPIAVFDRNGVFLMINQVGALNMGRPASEIIGRSLGDFIPEFFEFSVERYRRVIDHGESLQTEDCVPLPGGARWFWSAMEPVRDLHGKVYCVQVISYDITERKAAQAALRESEEQYRAVVEDQTEIITRFLPDGTLTFANEVCCRFFRKPAAEIVGFKWQPNAEPEDLPMIEAKLATLSPANPVVTIENRIYNGAGELRWMQFVNRGFFDESGSLQYLQSVGRDITERKNVEQALRDLLENLEQRAQERASALEASDTALRVNVDRLRLVEQATHDGIWDWDMVAGVEYHSTRWKEILGFGPDELPNVPATFFDRLHPEDRPEVDRVRVAHLENGSPYEVEARLRHKLGHYCWILSRGQAVRDITGRVVRMVGSITDISERKQAERRIRALSELGRKLNSTRSHREAALCALDVAQELLGWDACVVELYAPPNNEVVSVILMDTVNGHKQEFPFDKERQQSRKVVAVPLAEARLVLRKPGEAAEAGLRTFGDTARRSTSLLFAPICSKNQVIGMFSIQSYAFNAYNESARETVQMLADYCGGAFERILTQAALADSEARFAAFMNFLPAAAYIKDAEGRHLFVNRHLVESVGLAPESWLGRRLSEMIPSNTAATAELNDRKLLASGKPQVYEEQLVERGKARTYLSSKFPIPQADGATLLGGVSFEITERREAEHEREILLAQVQSARNRLEQLSRRLLEVQESERRRLARDLHDQVGQALTAIQIKLQTASRNAILKNVRTNVVASLGMLDELVQLTQNISLNLRPSILDDLGLETALRWLTEHQVAEGGPRGEFQPAPLESRLQPEIETACFRVAQEAITNILRHARASEFIVSLRRDGELLGLFIHDDGVGFDPQARLKSPERFKDLGLLGMEERVALVGGRLEIESSAHTGTTVNAWFPVKWCAPNDGSI